MNSQIIPILLTSIAALLGLILFLFFFEFMGRMGKLLVKQSQELEAEIAERKKAQEVADASLREKELLLREIHHRVKNNLQIIASLFRIQMRSIDDERVKTILRDSQSRIRAMSLIHEMLYQPRDLANINFRGYLIELASNLIDSYQIDIERVSLAMEVEDIQMDIDTAIPCGLIVNELITNALKYAFPDGRRGQIKIVLTTDQELPGYCLTISDNGVGLPKGLDPFSTKTLGLQLVVNLTRNQLHGRLDIHDQEGAAFIIRFRELEHVNRIEEPIGA